MMSLFRRLFSQYKKQERSHARKRKGNVAHDLILFALFFISAIFVCILMSNIYDDNNQFSVPVFILVVALIARFTHGYLYGVVASLLGVFCVNFMFTYPYWHFDMTIAGYPLTFAAMLMVSIFISTLTTQIKRQEQLRSEVEMEKMRANLLRSVSHDLRTPLTSIIGSSSVLLEDRGLDAQQREELLKEINKDARWLVRITENILSVTKFSCNQVQLHRELEVVEEIVSSAIVKFKRSHSDILIRVHKPTEILLVPMDATLIEQVLLNLFDNAVVHGRHTSEIDIAISQAKDGFRVLISDNGVGIPPHIFPHLFDGKASAFKPNADNHRNMGIGLSVCQSIIHAHGGEIHAFNNKNGGASFEIQLPAEEECNYEQPQE